MSDDRPNTVVQATGAVAQDVVAGLKAQPVLLAIIVMNALAVLAAVWFLSQLAESAKDQRTQLLKIIETCLERRGDLQLHSAQAGEPAHPDK